MEAKSRDRGRVVSEMGPSMMNYAVDVASGLKSTHLLQLFVVEFEAKQSPSFGGEASVLQLLFHSTPWDAWAVSGCRRSLARISVLEHLVLPKISVNKGYF